MVVSQVFFRPKKIVMFEFFFSAQCRFHIVNPFLLPPLSNSNTAYFLPSMSVNVLSAPSSLSSIGNETQLDSAVHNLYKLYHHSPSPTVTRSTPSTSRHHRSDSRTITMEDDFMISYGRENAHSIAQTPVVRSKLNRLGPVPSKKPEGMEDEMMELIRNTAANARLGMPIMTDTSIRRKGKIHDRVVSFSDRPEYIITIPSSDSDSLPDQEPEEEEEEESKALTPPPSPTKRAVRTLRNTAKAVVKGKPPLDQDGKATKELRSRPVSAPPALASNAAAQRPNQTLKTIGKWLTDKNKWLNVDRNFLY